MKDDGRGLIMRCVSYNSISGDFPLNCLPLPVSSFTSLPSSMSLSLLNAFPNEWNATALGNRGSLELYSAKRGR